MEFLNALFRWVHILAGIVWIGMLYFFNLVNGPFQGTMDGDTKKKVVPGADAPRPVLVPLGRGLDLADRASFSWCSSSITGHHLRRPDETWTPGAIGLIVFVFVAPFVYDALHKSGARARTPRCSAPSPSSSSTS